MKKSVKAIIGLGLTLLVIGGYLLGVHFTGSFTDGNTVGIQPQASLGTQEFSDNNNIVLRDQISVLRQEITDLKTEISLIKAALAQTSSSEKAKTGSTTDAHTKLQHVSRSEEQSKTTQRARDLGFKLDQQFRQETTDKGWSEQTQTAVKSALLSQKIPEAGIIALECRLNTCRIELANDEYNNPPDISDLPLLIGDKLSQLIVDNRNSYDDQADTILVYLSNQPLSEE